MEPLSDSDKRSLLGHARASIAAHLAHSPTPDPPDGSAALIAPRAAFVTLRYRIGRDLRGCIGQSEPVWPLAEAVSRSAIASAMADPRFAPVTLAELPHLTVEISALGPLVPIAPDEVEIGRHGLMITGEAGSALLLPHVPLAFKWDRAEFLARLCEKGGLDRDAWSDPALRLLGFETDTWEED